MTKEKLHIITHSGTFHADEVFAIALLAQFYELRIERTNKDPEKQLQEKDTVIIDIGKNYNPEFNNYDHHQDENLDASCMLVLYSDLTDLEKEIKDILAKKLFGFISQNDLGKYPNTDKIPHISSIIHALNYHKEDNFEMALDIARKITEAYINNTKLYVSQKLLLENLPVYKNF